MPTSSPRRAEHIAIGLAIFGIATGIGAWVIGPSLTHKSAAPQAVMEKQMTYRAMLARPDPSPYGAPTPAFDTSDAPHYAAMARDKARAELGGHRTTEAAAADVPPEGNPYGYRASPRYRTIDRHTGVKY
jgi:hypothetical protein